MDERPAPLTPSQTVGPFFHFGLVWPDGASVVPEGTPGSFLLHGRVLDGAGAPVPDALVETWQADAEGRFDHPDDPRRPVALTPAGFRGFGRCPTDAEGRYGVLTVKPGAVAPAAAPHLVLSIFARGLLDRVVTRCYLPDDAEAHAGDPVLSALDPGRRATLVAVADDAGYRFDIRLQGPDETVFLAV